MKCLLFHDLLINIFEFNYKKILCTFLQPTVFNLSKLMSFNQILLRQSSHSKEPGIYFVV